MGLVRQVLVDAPGRGRTVHEAPEIDGVVHLPADTVAGELMDVMVTSAEGPDLYAERVDPAQGQQRGQPGQAGD